MRLRYLLGTLYLAFLGSSLDPAMILPTALALGIGYGIIDTIRDRKQK